MTWPCIEPDCSLDRGHAGEHRALLAPTEADRARSAGTATSQEVTEPSLADRARAEVQAAVMAVLNEFADNDPGDFAPFRLRAALNDTAALDLMLAEARAEAWDEGRDAGHEEARCVNPEYPARARNPYRAEGEGA